MLIFKQYYKSLHYLTVHILNIWYQYRFGFVFGVMAYRYCFAR